MQDHLKNFIAIVDKVSAVNSNKTSSVIFGLIQFRFFATMKDSCMGAFTNNTLLKKLINFEKNRKLICLAKRYDSDLTKDKTIKLNNYNYTEITGIEHFLYTPIGVYDNTGIICRFSSNE